MHSWLMPYQIVRSHFDTDQPTGFGNDYSGTFVGNRKNPFIWTLADFKGIFAEPVSDFLRYEYKFVFPAAFGFLKDRFTTLEVLQSLFQHLTDPHAAPGH